VRRAVRQIDEGQYAATFNGDPAIYRYWDATKCVDWEPESSLQFARFLAEQKVPAQTRAEKLAPCAAVCASRRR